MGDVKKRARLMCGNLRVARHSIGSPVAKRSRVKGSPERHTHGLVMRISDAPVPCDGKARSRHDVACQEHAAPMRNRAQGLRRFSVVGIRRASASAALRVASRCSGEESISSVIQWLAMSR